ncbi:hypothetical protein L7F22_036580 [Adiantum nelumboides]|nr:hypothetical protein [Adiantum nelumboides]
MARNFEKLEENPFFAAAEQVQDSADRLDSAFRAWTRAKTLPPEDAHVTTFYGDVKKGPDVLEFYRRELATTFGIAAGQLAELEKDISCLPEAREDEDRFDDDFSKRHTEFISAISNQINSLKSTLSTSTDLRDTDILLSGGRGCLKQAEIDEFALFLSGGGAGFSSASNIQSTGTSCSPTLYHSKGVGPDSTNCTIDGYAWISDVRSTDTPNCSGSNDKGRDPGSFIIAINDQNTSPLLKDCSGRGANLLPERASTKSEPSLTRQVISRATPALLYAALLLFLIIKSFYHE